MPVGTSRPLGLLLRRVYDVFVAGTYDALALGRYWDIRPSHGAVFRHLEDGGSRVSVIAARAGMTKQSMTYLVEDLAALGYVELAPDPTDGRARLIHLTAKGQALWTEMIRLNGEVEQRLQGNLTATEVAMLRDLLTRLVNGLDKKATADRPMQP
ncbi:MarR family winged helix-turn-helix transcriptional regulator [Lichenicoccus roseus]|uniref:Winged helix-turn-helix transcriptional regulator n=1 Tax=Lichenicoccus roseus TaxID=2683649 RepID=A0A5R9J9Q3_9PROT|nr:MarR family winged helix-turn-helix transcriptional regulator [Lichenicoccus roseus]TLU73277.1 winged helix-turn-helix transcriptional regulator [Lichenicoccus roseus]